MDPGIVEPCLAAFWVSSHVHAGHGPCVGPCSPCASPAFQSLGLGGDVSSMGSCESGGFEHGLGMGELGFGAHCRGHFGPWRDGQAPK